MRTAAVLVAVAAGVAAPPATAKVPARCVFERPCVFVTPDLGAERPRAGTVLTFRGRGWRPRGTVEAQYGEYCPPRPEGGVCPAIGYSTLVKADRRGRFRFTFRYGDQLPRGVRGPKAAGAGEVTFSGVSARGRRVDRFAVPPPPRSTRAQRAQAAAVRDATRALLRDLRRAAPRTWKAQAAYEQQVRRCQDIVRIDEPPRQAAVIDRVVDAASDAATFGRTGRELERFASRLERLKLDDPALAAGADAWVRAIRAPRYAPAPSLCAVLEAWRDTGFSLDAEPVDPARVGLAEEVGRDAAIQAAGRRLRDLGIGRSDTDLFEHDAIGLEVYLGGA